MAESPPAVVVLNGCFGVGKSTVATALSLLVPTACVVEPDIFAKFHPQHPPAGFDVHDYTWSAVFLIVSHAVSRALTCVMPVVLAPGLTSTTFEMLRPRLEALPVPTYYYKLSAPLERVRDQNRTRADVKYPEHIIEKCWSIMDGIGGSPGAEVRLGSMDNRAEVPRLIWDLVRQGSGMVGHDRTV